MAQLQTSFGHIFYQCFGDPQRPALIFSNSLGTDFSMWQQQIDHFQNDYYVVCYDTRGHGQSSAPQGPYQLQHLADDVIALMDHLELSRAAFCGISMGGITAQYLAIHHPTRFSQVIICNSAAKIGQAAAWHERAALVRQHGLSNIAATAAGRWFTEGFIQAQPQTIATLSQKLAAGNPEGYASCCEALAEADLRDAIQHISVNTLIIAGTHDPVTTVLDAEFMQQHIQNSQLALIEASHISNIEDVAGFNLALDKFLQAAQS